MKFPTMTYFEAKNRLDNLVKFRSLYRDYLEFTNRENNVPAQMIRTKMQSLTDMTLDSLKRIRLGSLITKEAPTQGGKKIKINLIRAIFREHIIRQFKLDEQTPLRILDRAISKYKSQLWKEKVQLYNPFFWLYHFTEFLTRVPILIFQKAGIETHDAEYSLTYRIFTALVQLVIFYYAVDTLGLVDWVKKMMF